MLCCFSGTTYDIITFLICIIRKREYLQDEKRSAKSETPFFFTLKSLPNRQQLFFLHKHFDVSPLIKTFCDAWWVARIEIRVLEVLFRLEICSHVKDRILVESDTFAHFPSKNVVSGSEISAVNLIVRWKLFVGLMLLCPSIQ